MSLLRIELLESCNPVSERSYNTLLNEDVFYNRYGLPYLPAWFIRTRLYSIAQKILNPEKVNAVFDSLILDDALIAYNNSLVNAIESSDKKFIRFPQNVLGKFTHIETKFINGVEVGVRMLDRGLIFEQYFTLDDEYYGDFCECVKNFTSLNTNQPSRIESEIDKHYIRPRINTQIIEWEEDHKYSRINYKLNLLSSTCITNELDTNSTSMQYIPGYEILRAVKTKFADLNIKCSCAYPEIENKRGFPVPISFTVLKTDETQLRDKISLGRNDGDNSQTKGLANLWAADIDNCDIKAVAIELERGIISQDGEKFSDYQAISSGQIFRGFIEADSETLRKIYDYFVRGGYISIGSFNNIGFGRAYLTIDSLDEESQQESQNVQEFTLEIMSPLVMKNSEGVYYDGQDALINELERKLNLPGQLEIMRNYKSSVQVVRFCDDWDEFYPVEYAMSAGSIFRIKRKDNQEINISPLKSSFIGEYNESGFGEIFAAPSRDIYYRTIAKSKARKENLFIDSNTKPGKYLLRSLNDDYINMTAEYFGRLDAEEFYTKFFEKNAFITISELAGTHFDKGEILERYLYGLAETCKNLLKR
ncbi:MAG: hypothetical protein IJT21_06715 [Synergistaceae bacterium]|nr:hypothetical protein [Synergistaceae bacterium]